MVVRQLYEIAPVLQPEPPDSPRALVGPRAARRAGNLGFAFSFVNVFWRISIFWMLIPLIIFTPFFCFTRAY